MVQEVKIYNTLSGKKEVLVPKKKNKVHLYSCGPTVYDFAHIGNFRSFLMSDLLCRVLRYAGYEVVKVQNITDVGHLTNDDLADSSGEDKIAKKAKKEGMDAFAVAEKFTDFFIEDEKTLKIIPPNHRPKATDFIPQQIEMTKTLIKKGLAYEVNGSVYFRTTKFKAYGKLSKNNLKDLQAGARVEVNDEKENPLDFALWKRADETHLMQWDFHTGQRVDPKIWEKYAKLTSENEKSKELKKDFPKSYRTIQKENPQLPEESVFDIFKRFVGFPGWHIECSAMSRAILGYVDIHTGGEDNIFPHHECEIAQNECCCDMQIPYWMHTKHLLVNGQKMSKSKGNFFTIRDLLHKGWKGEEIRLALISAHYRTAFNFTEKSLKDARKMIKKIHEAYWQFSQISSDSRPETSKKEAFKAALCDDLNVSKALAIVFEIISDGYKLKANGTLTPEKAGAIVRFLENDFNSIFEVLPLNKPQNNIPDEVAILLQERKKAREKKDWKRSDELREEIRALGFEVLDEKEGQRIIPL